MTLRVISGSAKGRRLKTVPGDTTRPVTDMVKEALFDILAGDVIDSAWWDLFAGTGAIGIEALSRGASSVLFSDLNRLPVETIRENLAHCGFASQGEIRRADALSMLAASPSRRFDYIYVAPPQYKELWSQALALLDGNSGWLSEGGWAIAQIHPSEYQDLTLRNLEKIEQRKYGSTLLLFYEKVGESSGAARG
jgi:16S rRNA (guanine(966)-N(2))-methyltransferase RsmD